MDITKVKMDVLKPWIAHRATELLGFEDEVLINFIYGLLEGKVMWILYNCSGMIIDCVLLLCASFDVCGYKTLVEWELTVFMLCANVDLCGWYMIVFIEYVVEALKHMFNVNVWVNFCLAGKMNGCLYIHICPRTVCLYLMCLSRYVIRMCGLILFTRCAGKM